MSLKTKIFLGFLAVLLLLGVGTCTLCALRRLDRSAASVLKDNFYSVQLGQRLYAALDQLAPAEQQRYLAGGPTPPAGYEATVQRGLHQFQASLTREAGNSTEPGERALVDSLARGFAAYQQLLGPPAAGPRTAAFYLAHVLPRHQQLRALNGAWWR